MALPDRKTARLRFGRRSVPGAIYFVTFCTKDRKPVLSAPAVTTSILGVLRSMDTTHDIGLFAASVMPDHLHLLFELGPRLQIGQVVGKIKALSRPRGETPGDGRTRHSNANFGRKTRLRTTPSTSS